MRREVRIQWSVEKRDRKEGKQMMAETEYRPTDEHGAKRYQWCKANPDKIDLSRCMTCSEYYEQFKQGNPVCDIYQTKKSGGK